MSQINRYRYPLCPSCEKKGSKIESTINEYTSEGCQIGMYWYGGYSLRDEDF